MYDSLGALLFSTIKIDIYDTNFISAENALIVIHTGSDFFFPQMRDNLEKW